MAREPRLRRQEEARRDQVQPRHRPGVRRQQRLPGRLDVQGVRGCGRAGEGLSRSATRSTSPYQAEHRRRAGLQRDADPGRGSPYNETTSENGTYTLQTGIEGSINTYFAQLEERVGVCRPGADRRGARHAPRRRQAAPGRSSRSPSASRGVAAVDGRGLRDVRRPRRALQLDRDHSRSTDPSGNRLPVPAGRLRAGARPGHRRRHQRAAAGRHRRAAPAPGPRSAARRPARPAPPTSASRSGSSATRPTSRPRSGPATRARPPEATRCRTGRSAASTTATSAAAACPARSGSR